MAGPRRVAIGCMRLSTGPTRDEPRAVAVLHAALDAGVTLLDTADAYCLDASETGHNERLIARALSSWSGDRSSIEVATKGGLTRPGGRWEADGRARALTAACEASLRALDVSRIALYQLHAPDPRVPLATSVRALDALKRRGLIERIGLCNVTVAQIEEARRLTEIAAVQVELSLWQDAAVLGGVVRFCAAHDIALLAYRPFGGAEHRRRVEADPLLAEIGLTHHATPFEVALAALAGLSPVVVPLPGPGRIESARSVARAAAVELGEEDRTRLAGRFPSPRATAVSASRVTAHLHDDGEIVLVMGLPGAGKSTIAARLAADGYVRVNRDEAGGSLTALLPLIDREIAGGARRLVLDNTYVTRKSRGAVVQAAARHGLPVRCVWLTTSVEDAQVNAATRIVRTYGCLPSPEALKAAARTDPAAFPPGVQFRFQRELEPPDPAEGFSRIDEVRFERVRDPSHLNRAVLVWCDGILLRSLAGHRVPREPDDVEVVGERGGVLRRFSEDGWLVLGLAWLPEIADGAMTAEDAAAVFGRLADVLDVPIEVEYCPHPAGPPVCWCRKPLPGLGVVFQQRHGLDPAQCLYVGAGPQDPGFARRLGIRYQEASGFFGDPV